MSQQRRYKVLRSFGRSSTNSCLFCGVNPHSFLFEPEDSLIRIFAVDEKLTFIVQGSVDDYYGEAFRSPERVGAFVPDFMGDEIAYLLECGYIELTTK
jgi:hypothetical protein